MADSPFITLANKYQPAIRKAMIAMWNDLRTQHTTTAIEAAFNDRGLTGVMEMYDNVPMATAKALNPIIDDTLRAGADMTIALVPSSAFLITDATVSLYHPVTVTWLQRYKFELVNEISKNTLEAMRDSLIEDMIAGVNPRTTARNFRNTIGLTPFQQKAVRNYRSYLQTLDPQALQRALRDKRSDSVIQRAIRDNEPLSAGYIEKLTNKYRARYINYRAETIARTESMRALSIGNRAAIEQLANDGAIGVENLRRFWKYTHDGRTRHAHREIPKLNPDGVAINEPFKTPLGPLMFPRDPAGSAANTIQ